MRFRLRLQGEHTSPINGRTKHLRTSILLERLDLRKQSVSIHCRLQMLKHELIRKRLQSTVHLRICKVTNAALGRPFNRPLCRFQANIPIEAKRSGVTVPFRLPVFADKIIRIRPESMLTVRFRV